MSNLLDKFKVLDKEQEAEVKPVEKPVVFLKKATEKKSKKPKKTVQISELNKSLELNLIKSLYANRFGSTTNKVKKEMQKALINEWNKEKQKKELK